jgi:hypothetical protein
MREFFHQPFDDVTQRHMIERRAQRSADHNRIEIEGLGALAKARQHCATQPNRDDFDLTLAHRLQGGLNGLRSLLVGPVRRVAGE